MGHFSAYSVGTHALAVNSRRLATFEAAHSRWASSEDSYAAPVDRRTPLDHPGLRAEVPPSGRARVDAVSDEVATMRSIHISVEKLRIGLCTFVVCGALGGFVLGWSLVVSLAVGLLLALIIGPVAGSFLGPRSFRVPPWTGAMIASLATDPEHGSVSVGSRRLDGGSSAA